MSAPHISPTVRLHAPTHSQVEFQVHGWRGAALGRASAAAVAAVSLWLAGCAQTPSTAPGARSGSATTPGAAGSAGRTEPQRPETGTARAAPTPLATEQRWLSQWFDGTPVRITGQSDGRAVLLAVPLDFAFDAQSPRPKPALQAVLDKVGQSLKRQPSTRLRIGAPGPAARALSARAHVLAQGVASYRVEASAQTVGEDVLLRLSLAPLTRPAGP
jgi:outer membrane protein OmpA-like peptidoglycan-associated protein